MSDSTTAEGPTEPTCLSRKELEARITQNKVESEGLKVRMDVAIGLGYAEQAQRLGVCLSQKRQRLAYYAEELGKIERNERDARRTKSRQEAERQQQRAQEVALAKQQRLTSLEHLFMNVCVELLPKDLLRKISEEVQRRQGAWSSTQETAETPEHQGENK